MGAYTVIPENTFESLQLDAGILLKEFDPSNPSVTDANIICATTGGISVSAVPTYSDLGEDVDNCPNNMKELKHLDSWECTVGFTALTINEDTLKLALGAAEVDDGAIMPRSTLSQSDFQDLWWVGDMADGGFAAVKAKNMLSTSGISLQTTKNGKGQLACELTGHVSINAQTVMPMEFYVIAGESGGVVDIGGHNDNGGVGES